MVNAEDDIRPSRISNVSHTTTTTLLHHEYNEAHEYDSPVEAYIKPTSYHRAIPPVLPENHTFRTLVLCFDGTGDQFDMDNSNVVEFFSLLKKDDKTKQMVYYQAGIGTYTQPAIVDPAIATVSKVLDEMVAWNLDSHVMDGYSFLMENYTAGDRINLFGFSRGAYTARALAGMLHKVGLLPASNHQQVPFAYKMYAREDDIGWKQSNAFKKAFCTDVEIEFIGVWDTVASVGLIPRRLPFTADNTVVKTFRHALALDEHRSKFKANMWSQNESKGGSSSSPEKQHVHLHALHSKRKGSVSSLSALEDLYETHRSQPTDVREVWFSGCHADVGGGSVTNDTPHSLARIPLRWMVKECFRTHTGIMFETEGLQRIGLNLGPLLEQPSMSTSMLTKPLHIPDGSRLQKVPKTHVLKSKIESLFHGRKNINYRIEPPKDNKQTQEISEEDHDVLDLLSPVYDQLRLKWYWWILEILPLDIRHHKRSGWRGTCNLGRPRTIPYEASRPLYIHRSVKARMETFYEGERKHGGKRYVPKAAFDVDRVTWVD